MTRPPSINARQLKVRRQSGRNVAIGGADVARSGPDPPSAETWATRRRTIDQLLRRSIGRDKGIGFGTFATIFLKTQFKPLERRRAFVQRDVNRTKSPRARIDEIDPKRS